MARKVIVAVHGMGDQFRYTTIQSVANQVCRYFNLPDALPAGRFHSTLFDPPAETAAPLANLIKAASELLDSMERKATEEIARRTEAVQKLLKAAAKVAPPVSALVLEPPEVPVLPVDFGFAEVYWAHIPRVAVKDEYVLEETKRWGRTVVERLRLQYVAASAEEQLDADRYELAGTVIDEVVETVRVLDRLTLLADKAGLFQFDLKKQLDDYLGDVQIVTEFKHHRDLILRGFDDIMQKVAVRMKDDGEDPELYVVAHSEGTVVAFLGLLDALGKPATESHWVKLVKGFMTFGSPINKHLVLWPELWHRWYDRDKPHEKKAVRTDVGEGRIRWRNYYDYGDPVGFELTEARKWLKKSGFGRYFEFQGGVCHDVGFARYVLPGLAHIGYWDDEAVFGHFIHTVIEPKKDGEPPPGVGTYGVPKNRWPALVFGPCLPYLLAAALCVAGMYLIYKGVCEVIRVDPSFWRVIGDVLGLSGMLAAFLVIARIPRLTIWVRYHVWSLGMLPLAAGLYALTMSDPTLKLLSVPPPDAGWPLRVAATGEMVLVVGVISLLTQIVGNLRPRWMTTRNVVLTGFVVSLLFVVLVLLRSKDVTDPDAEIGSEQPPWWLLAMGGAAAFYLWRLAAMVFDLAFVWHRYVRHSVMDKYLGRMLWRRKDYYEKKNQLVKQLLDSPAPSEGAAVALSVPAAVPNDRIRVEMEKEAQHDAAAARQARRSP